MVVFQESLTGYKIQDDKEKKLGEIKIDADGKPKLLLYTKVSKDELIEITNYIISLSNDSEDGRLELNERNKRRKQEVGLEYISPTQRYALENPSIGIDLDRTLCYFDKWNGINNVGDLLYPMVVKLKEAKKLGYKIKILTARVSDIRAYHPIYEFLKACEIPFDDIVLEKDASMVEIWDDKAVAVEPNTGYFKYFNSSKILGDMR